MVHPIAAAHPLQRCGQRKEQVQYLMGKGELGKGEQAGCEGNGGAAIARHQSRKRCASGAKGDGDRKGKGTECRSRV